MSKYQVIAPSKNNTAEMIRVLTPLIIIVALYFVGKKFFSSLFSPITGLAEGLNISDTPEEKKKLKKLQDNLEAINNASSNKNPFDPNYWDLLKIGKTQQVALLKVAKANELASRIYNAIGYIYDSPEDILGAIKQCKYKSQISFVSKYFYEKYKKDMLTWLADKLDTTYQKIILGDIITYVNGLPSGIISK